MWADFQNSKAHKQAPFKFRQQHKFFFMANNFRADQSYVDSTEQAGFGNVANVAQKITSNCM